MTMRSFKTLTVLTLMLFATLSCSVVRAAGPTPITIPCTGEVTAPQDLERTINDVTPWVFSIVPGTGVTLSDVSWKFNGLDPDSADADQGWGTFVEGTSPPSLSWTSDPRQGLFTVTVKFKRKCGPGGPGGGQPMELSWAGEVTTCGAFSAIPSAAVTLTRDMTLQPWEFTTTSGQTWGLDVSVTISACIDPADGMWHAKLLSVNGTWYSQVRLVPPVTQVIVPPAAGGNVINADYCNQVHDLLDSVAYAAHWYTIEAVKVHEAYHSNQFQKELYDATTLNWQKDFEKNVKVSNTPAKTKAQAIAALYASTEFDENRTELARMWKVDFIGGQVGFDDNFGAPPFAVHNPPAYAAELPVGRALATAVCQYAKDNAFAEACASCADLVP